MRVVLCFLWLVTAIAWPNPAEADQLTLRWQDNSTDEDGFEIERRTDTTGDFARLAVVGPKLVAYTDSAVTAGTVYCYRVRAFNAAGFSPYSNEACGTPPLPPGGHVTFSLAATPAQAHPGDRFRADFTLMNSGPAMLADVYLGVALPPELGPSVGCPAGDAVVFVADAFTKLVVSCLSAPPRTFAPLARNWPVPPEVTLAGTFAEFAFTWSESLPAGAYTFFVALTRQGAFLDNSVDAEDIIALATEHVSFTH